MMRPMVDLSCICSAVTSSNIFAEPQCYVMRNRCTLFFILLRPIALGSENHVLHVCSDRFTVAMLGLTNRCTYCRRKEDQYVAKTMVFSKSLVELINHLAKLSYGALSRIRRLNIILDIFIL